MKYHDELIRSMKMLSEHDKTIFIGQAVEYGGTGTYDSLINVPSEKKVEFPVAEALQMGMSIGLAMNGFIPVSIFVRYNFLLLAIDQLVNHLDKIPLASNGEYKPNVIIRVSIGSEHPIHPQEQHVGNFSSGLKQMLKTIDLIELIEPDEIYPAYEFALNRKDGKSTILVESADFCKVK